MDIKKEGCYMKKMISFILKFVAIMSFLCAIGYWLAYFFSATQRKCCMVMKSDFDDEFDSNEETDEQSCGCNDAVCAVDMCMPY